ncbi:MAG: hypothetical protein IH845_05070, partial [Nanoarchaeota archaeon]|nr:hypothetical protein [Nanoarchaeota archaeon]
MLRKICVGYGFAILSMFCAAFVELYRIRLYHMKQFAGTSVCNTSDSPMAVDMSIFWQVPQFVFVGISEVLASITALEFFYDQAPLSMRSVCSALNLVTTG